MSDNEKKANRVDHKWMCVNIKGGKVDNVNYNTLKWTRKESLAAMMWNKSGRPAYSWRELRSYGWRCIKVSIEFHVKPANSENENRIDELEYKLTSIIVEKEKLVKDNQELRADRDKYEDALTKLANQTDEMIGWLDAGARSRGVSQQALKK